MRIHRLRLANYRGVEAREVAFAERGVTVVEGPNEVGKSSLAEALDLLLEHYDDSRKAAVRATKPVHADVGTEVEAEISAGPYRFTYGKRFHRERATTLTVHEPRAEHLTGREAHERVRAILSETVDLPLWRALRIVQGQVVEQPDLSEVSALAAALDVASSGAMASGARSPGGPLGGEREHSLLERVQDEYGRYFTPTGQDNAWFKGLRAELDAAQADAAKAAQALAALEQDIDSCARIARELQVLRPEHARQLARLEELEQRWARVQQRVTHVERLQLEAERAHEALRQAERALTERERLVQAAGEAAGRAAALEAEQAQLAPALRDAAEEEERLQGSLTALRTALAGAREAERGAHEAEARSREAFSLELLEERWARVVAARAQAADARDVLDGVTLDESVVERIEAAHLTLAQARARLEDDGPAVRLSAAEATTVEVDGEALEVTAEPLELRLTEQMHVRIGTVDALLSPGQGLEALRERHAHAERALAAACAAAGVAGLPEARAALRRRHDAERVLAETDRVLRDNLRDLSPDELRDKVDRLRARVSTATADADVDAAKQAREQAEEQVRELESGLAQAEGSLSEAAARRAALRDQDTLLRARLDTAAQDRAAAEAALGAARADAPDGALATHVAAAAEARRTAESAFSAARSDLDAEDPGTLRAEVDNASALAEKQRREVREREEELHKLQGRLSGLGEMGLHDRLAAAETRLERARVAWSQASRGAAAARFLHDTLLRHREAARRAYVAPLREKLESLGRIVFGPDFAVELDDDLRVARRTLDGITLDAEQLSSGAREQLAVLSRLAVAAITAGDGGVPVIFDDALGWSDPQRLERIGAAFHVAARDSQVIVLTCVPERYAGIGSAHVVRL